MRVQSEIQKNSHQLCDRQLKCRLKILKMGVVILGKVKIGDGGFNAKAERHHQERERTNDKNTKCENKCGKQPQNNLFLKL